MAKTNKCAIVFSTQVATVNCLPVGIHLNLIRGMRPRINQSQCSFCWVKVSVYKFHMSANLWPLIPWEQWVILCTTWPWVFGGQLFSYHDNSNSLYGIYQRNINILQNQQTHPVSSRFHSPQGSQTNPCKVLGWLYLLLPTSFHCHDCGHLYLQLNYCCQIPN